MMPVRTNICEAQVIDIIDKRVLWLKRKSDGQTTGERLYKSPVFVPFVKDFKVGDLPSFATDPFQGWAKRILSFCRR